MNQRQKKVNFIRVSEDDADQRLDNFLMTRLKTVPKSHVYKIIRSGEVRVNSRRVSAYYRILKDDMIRLPPLLISEKAHSPPPNVETLNYLKGRIIYEDENIIILNKPAGMSVHAGSTVRLGIIEAMKYLFPKLPQLELVHRLDSETSGCLILAKKKRVLRELHQLLREGAVIKIYWVLTKGQWQKKELSVDLPLNKHYERGSKHVVRVHKQGKTALTVFKTLTEYADASLMEAKLFTGRTHQIRVHASAKGHVVAGDDRYGDAEFNKKCRKIGLRRMFLHAKSIEFTLPSTGQHIRVVASLDKELEFALKNVNKMQHADQKAD